MTAGQQFYYPSVVANFRIRFDEALNIREPLPIPRSVPLLVRAAAEVFAEPLTTRPLVAQAGADVVSIVANRVPKQASVELNGFRQAGKFTMVFDWRELPIDPRVIRAHAVEIHIGTVAPGDFAAGMTRVEADGSRRSIIRTSLNGFPNTRTLKMVGLVDNATVEHGDKSSELHIEGRDLRGILLDSFIDPSMLGQIDVTRQIDVVVRQILSFHPFGARFMVLTLPTDWPGFVPPSPGTRDGLTRASLGAKGEQATNHPQGDASRLSFWDVITHYCFLVGAVPYFQGQIIRIRAARSIYDQLDPDRPDSPFNGLDGSPAARDDGAGNKFTVRTVVYGRHIQTLKYERKYTGQRNQVIELVCIDTSSGARGMGRLLKARWPDVDPKEFAVAGGKIRSEAVTNVATSGETETAVRRVAVAGVRSVEQLREMAKNIYEEVARGEMGGSCETKSLASFGGSTEGDSFAGNVDPDLLRIAPGDAVRFAVDARALADRNPLVAELVDTERRSFDEQVAAVRKAMTERTGAVDENVARAIVASARADVVKDLSFFRTANVRFNWSHEDGIIVAFDFQNYIQVRSGVTDAIGASVLPPAPKKAGYTAAEKDLIKSAATPAGEALLAERDRINAAADQAQEALVRTARARKEAEEAAAEQRRQERIETGGHRGGGNF